MDSGRSNSLPVTVGVQKTTILENVSVKIPLFCARGDLLCLVKSSLSVESAFDTVIWNQNGSFLETMNLCTCRERGGSVVKLRQSLRDGRHSLHLHDERCQTAPSDGQTRPVSSTYWKVSKCTSRLGTWTWATARATARAAPASPTSPWNKDKALVHWRSRPYLVWTSVILFSGRCPWLGTLTCWTRRRLCTTSWETRKRRTNCTDSFSPCIPTTRSTRSNTWVPRLHWNYVAMIYHNPHETQYTLELRAQDLICMSLSQKASRQRS